MKVSRTQTVTVLATDNEAVTQITLTIDGNTVAVSQDDSLSYKWGTRKRGQPKHASHTVTVEVSVRQETPLVDRISS